MKNTGSAVANATGLAMRAPAGTLGLFQGSGVPASGGALVGARRIPTELDSRTAVPV